ncbi:hypothetical protein Ln9_0024 [Leuconostoc phage Ln-9]|uniref:Uncharacterized protein n=1 Tax=Leuconostoc phage Ln-9 TaxID=1536605 RepID=A0A0D3MJZ6_9CAUD|nr:hypothetical protein ACQ47_gp24 [Leuconostoc phage Ln-9]AIM50873.1 hypothetical protein Ln9_0024 [Leuconostoc phage Ln-9]
MTNFINNKALPVTFWQKDTTGAWNDYSIPIYITKDISTIEGIREVVVQFMTDPSEIGYYPRQNDIMIPAVDTSSSNFKFYGLSWTTPYFMDDFLEDTTIGNGVMFLKDIDGEKYKFTTIFNLEEEVIFFKGNYSIENILSYSAKEIWDRLIGGHPYLKQYGSGTSAMPVKYKTLTYNYYDKPTVVNINDIFEKFVSGLSGDFDLTLKTYPNSNDAVILDVILRNGSSEFSLPITTEKIIGYSKRTRNRTDGTNLVYGYNQTTGAFYKYAWLDKKGMVNIGTTYPATNTPRFGYCALDGDNPTDGELKTRASSMLKGSIYSDYDEYDLLIDMSNRYEYGTRNNPSLPTTSENNTQQMFLNTIVNVIGITDTPVQLEVRELDLLNGHIIVGKNNDITLGD